MNKTYTENHCLWQQLSKEKRPIFLYGTGNGADKILNICTNKQIPIEGVFASDGFVRSRSFREMPVQSLAAIEAAYGDDLLCCWRSAPLCRRYGKTFEKSDSVTPCLSRKYPCSAVNCLISPTTRNTCRSLKKHIPCLKMRRQKNYLKIWSLFASQGILRFCQK